MGKAAVAAWGGGRPDRRAAPGAGWRGGPTRVWIPVLVAGATAFGLAGCSSSSTPSPSTAPPVTQPPATTTPDLSRQVAYGGLSLQVPATFTVHTFSGCPPVPDGTAQVGAFVSPTSACPSASTATGAATGMAMSSSALVAHHGAGWQTVSTVNGITVDSSELPPTTGSCSHGPCTPTSKLLVLFPSYEVGAEFAATGSDAASSLALAQAIVKTVAVHTSF